MKTELLEISDKIRNTGYLTMADKQSIADTLDRLAGGRPVEEKAESKKVDDTVIEVDPDQDDLTYARNMVKQLTGELTKAAVRQTMERVKSEHNDINTHKDVKKQLKGTYKDLKRLVDLVS